MLILYSIHILNSAVFTHFNFNKGVCFICQLFILLSSTLKKTKKKCSIVSSWKSYISNF
jgi:hypothetical protein